MPKVRYLKMRDVTFEVYVSIISYDSTCLGEERSAIVRLFFWDAR